MRIEFAQLAAVCCLGLLMPALSLSQEPAAAPQDQKAPPPPPAPLPPKSKDYPYPRGLMIGAFYWAAIPGLEPDFRGGKQAGQFQDISGLGKPKQAPGVEVSYPVTRTGTLRAEGFQLKGAGSQTLGKDSAPLGLQYSKGDLLSTNYRLRGGKFWLDDLFWPHKYPVAKFRLKSILGVEYLQMRSAFDAPLKATTSSLATWSTNGTRQLVLPALGMAAEYAISPHVLFRAGGSGFDLPHKSYFYDGDVSLAVRRKHLELVVGFKALGSGPLPR